MRSQTVKFYNRLRWILIIVAAGIAIPGASVAKPPPWAPANGYRAKHMHLAPPYEYSYQHHYFGVLDGHCNHRTIGTILGGVAGGSIGGHLVGDDDATAGAVAGVLLGAMIGNAIGRSMDNADRWCAGHVLEFTDDRHSVVWTNLHNNLTYTLTPLATREDGQRYCREFSVRLRSGALSDEVHRIACRSSAGIWRVDR